MEIQKSLHVYAAAQGVKPLKDLSTDVIKTIKDNKGTENDHNPMSDRSSDQEGWFGGWKSLLLSALIALGGLFFFLNVKGELDTLQKKYAVLQEDCDSISNSLHTRIDMYDQISSKRNTPIFFAATDNYSETKLILHYNPSDRRNYIQVYNLPTLEAGQAFQLWSLKDGVDPIPLTVFSKEDGDLIPVDFEEGTGTYAITIEKAGGVDSPTLTRLIGTAGV